jgi:hypothetical protein
MDVKEIISAAHSRSTALRDVLSSPPFAPVHTGGDKRGFRSE